MKDNYRGITITATAEELLYLGMINAFQKGNFTLAGFDNYEHSSRQPWTFDFLPEAFLGFMGKLLRISVVQLDILMSFILPITLFILIYNLTLKLSGGSPYLSLLSSAGVLLGYPLFTGKLNILKDIFSLTYSAPLWFLRPISPQFNHIMLVLSLLLIYKALSSGKSLTLLVSGSILGLLFYTFIYYWTFIYAGLFVLFLIFIFKKEFNYVRNIIFIITVSLMISIPYWINYWKLIHFPNYDVLEYFHNVVSSHSPLLPLFHILLTTLILLTYYRKKLDFSFWYITGFSIGGIICVNQQILSGKIFIPGHWLGYSNKTFLIIALFASLKNFKENYIIKKMINHIFARRMIAGVIMCTLIFLAFTQQNNFFKSHRLFYSQKQSLANVFLWLGEHTEKNSVILTDPFNFFMRRGFPEPADVLAYSHNFSFLPISYGTIYSKEELEDRFLISLVILGYNLDEVKRFIEYSNGIHFLRIRAIEEYGGKKADPAYLNYLENKYKSLQHHERLIYSLKKYRLDYLLVDKNDTIINRLMLPKHIDALKLYDDGRFIVFKLNIR